jgi:Flp pilus assembly pilin Flp
MKSGLWKVGYGVAVALLAVAIGATLQNVVRKMFILPEGIIIVSLVIWLILHMLTTRKSEEKARRAFTKTSKEFRELVHSDSGQDIAEYAMMLVVILVIVIATVQLIGSKSNAVFSEVSSSVGY